MINFGCGTMKKTKRLLPSEWIRRDLERRKESTREMHERFGIQVDGETYRIACWMDAVEAYLDKKFFGEDIGKNK